MFKNFLLIGMGGFLGSIARYLVSTLNLSVSLFSIPVGTLLVNTAGSFLIGFLTGVADKTVLVSTGWRMFLMVGVCGGFTTFSTFTGENLMMMHNGQFGTVLLYTGLSITLGFIAVWGGYTLTNII